MTRRATYAPSLFSVETTRTAPPPYETSSLFNADAPEFLQYRDLVLALESPQLSALASSSIQDEELRASSSQRVEEVSTPPAQAEIERSESSTAPHRSEPTKSAFRSPNPLQFLKSLRRIEVPPDEVLPTLSAPLRPVPVVTPTPAILATPLASEHSSSTLHRTRSRSRMTSTHATHRGEGSEPTHRKRRHAIIDQLPPRPLQASPSQDRIRITGLPNPGEDDAWLGYGLLMTSLSAQFKSGTRSLTSTMRQVLSNHRKYVAPFGIYTTSRLTPP